MIELTQIHLAIGGKPVIRDVTLTVGEGVFQGLIGPNGSGKSTLLRVISGVLQPDSGVSRVGGQPVSAYPPKALARFLAVLPQEPLVAEGYTVREVIEMGRFPYQNWLGGGDAVGQRRIEAIMERLSIGHLADRLLSDLSGGERQRVALGKTMAQEPQVLLLDEPTTFLDIGYQLQLMEYIKEWKRESGLTVLAVLHDLNLAALYCEHLVLLHEGRVAAAGTPAEILDASRIEQVYGTRPVVLPHPAMAVPQILLQPGAGATGADGLDGGS